MLAYTLTFISGLLYAAVPARAGILEAERTDGILGFCGSDASGTDTFPSAADVQARDIIEPRAVSVDLHIHVIASSQTEAGGWLSDDTIARQVAAIQNGYRNTSITINYRGFQRHLHPGWQSPNEEMVNDVKRQYHVGDYRTLNLYTIPDFWYFGQCPLPQQADKTNPDYRRLSGCVIRSTAVPGGPIPGQDEGKTAVHEIGHWFGLWHVWESHGGESGCVGIGDEVDDTPPQDSAWGICEDWMTCPESGEGDPIHNFMNGTPDSCMWEFTPGQDARMNMIWQTYRLND